MKLDLTNKVVIVTGGSGGIGEATSVAFAKEKAVVIINYNSSEKKAQNVLSKVKVYSERSIVLKCDISKEKQVKMMMKEVYSKFGRIDILVNNAGIAKDSNILEKKITDWNKTLNTNLLGVFICSREASQYMLKQKSGNIINISSTSAIYSFSPDIADYDASKAGVISLTKNFAKALSPNVRVNCIAPGWVNTDINKGLPEEFLKHEMRNIYSERFAEPLEIANLCLFLASPKSSYINGTVITADGGHN